VTAASARGAARYLVPIPKFTVPAPWPVGRTVIHPGANAHSLLAGTPPAKFRDKGDLEPFIDEILNKASDGAIAEVHGTTDGPDAIAAVRLALDALRLFRDSRRFVHTLPFGLPGEIPHGWVDYVKVENVAMTGGMRIGDPPGGGFAQEDLDAWNASDGFGFLNRAIADPDASEGARRATIGAQLYSRAAIEQRADIKMLGVVATLEAWVLNRQPGAQTNRLARHVSWFGCGRHNNDLCGRHRPVCPYLRLEPGTDNKRLKTLRDLGNTHTPWRCSEWHRVMDWYDARSGTAHGDDPTAVDPRHADQAAFWFARYLAEPMLDWLRTHPNDPVGDLQRDLAQIAEPDGWATMVAALDSTPPPPVPPPL
jgi:hypothetical protein